MRQRKQLLWALMRACSGQLAQASLDIGGVSRWRRALSTLAATGGQFGLVASRRVQPGAGEWSYRSRLSRAIVACYNLWLSRSQSCFVASYGLHMSKKAAGMASHGAGCLRHGVGKYHKAADSQAGAPRVSAAFSQADGGAADTAAGLRPNPRGDFHGSYHASNAGSRCPLRSPNALLEPEDGSVHFRSSQQDSHHQPRKDAADVQRRAEVRASTGS
ncbi:protein of unknown function [Paraburkholderia dioscoreae]|uniref:Uncharacterized protein n=1 Tax=Paraburkholderia dioscoreae TaxID=2604047 RepID=A0A5Q4Z273_9BURK|nr:protein of unknown function [Paraburkholderia dioscoreae]